MIPEFSARAVTLEVLAHLERRREAIVADEADTRAAVEQALEPIRRAYAEAELPAAYMQALADEVCAAVPAKWRAVAQRFTALERRDFGLWRDGDLVARLSYVLGGLVLGGLIVAAPFIPIWEKWFPFALALAGWWLPSAQRRWHRRRYARALGDIALQLGDAQPRLEAHVDMKSLLMTQGDTHE